MVRDAIAHCFYKHRLPAIFQRHASRFLSDLSDRENVIFIDANCADAVFNAIATYSPSIAKRRKLEKPTTQDTQLVLEQFVTTVLPLNCWTRSLNVTSSKALRPKEDVDVVSRKAEETASSDFLAKSSITAIQAIFTDEKLAKQVLSAAKRVTKKRGREPEEASCESLAKRKKTMSMKDADTPAAIEESLALPESDADEEELAKTILHTNRAPLVLAFATKLLEYTMPSQPLSSRLSLAQAVVSVNARTKALSLGIEKGTSAEDDGWGQGQPKIRIMGRDIRVLKRWGYEWKGKSEEEARNPTAEGLEAMDSQKTLKQEGNTDDEPALWGLDLEALRSSNGPLVSGAHGSGLPIYTAQSARAYLLKSFASLPSPMDETSPPKKKSAAVLKAEKERNLGLVLRTLDFLFKSWTLLSREELDKRAWAWYVAVRPDVENGVAGWGGKGEVKLSQILNLRRKG